MRKINSKKGASEIVAYVLLILLAVGMSGIIYAWLKAQTPKDIVKCPQDISIYINAYSCNQEGNTINISFENRGLFNIDGVSILFSNLSNKEPYLPLSSTNPLGQVVQDEGFLYFNPSLPPRKEYYEVFNYQEINEVKKIQIIPFVLGERIGEDKGRIVICKDSISVKDTEKCI